LNILNIFEYNRIIILGNNGSGKSFLAKNLAAITALPLIHLDVAFWKPNWEPPSEEEWLNKITNFVSNDKWIIDGMCSWGETMDLRFKAADLIILLDINSFVCLAGVIKRQGKERSDTAVNHHLDEKFDRDFIKFCKGIFKFNKTRRLKIMGFHEKYPDKPFYVIKGRRNMNNLIRQWRNEKENRMNNY